MDYYTSDYDSAEEADEASKALISEIGAEGMVLAKSANNVLPLAQGSKITMLGRAAADPVYGRSSGSIDVTTAVTARQGLEDAGFEVNGEVFDAIEAFASDNPRGYIEMDKPDASSYNIGEMPVADYQGTVIDLCELSRCRRRLHWASRWRGWRPRPGPRRLG